MNPPPIKERSYNLCACPCVLTALQRLRLRVLERFSLLMILQLCSWLRHTMIIYLVPGPVSSLHCQCLSLLPRGEGNGEDVAVVFHKVNFQALCDKGSQVREVLSVLSRQDDAGHSCTLSLWKDVSTGCSSTLGVEGVPSSRHSPQ